MTDASAQTYVADGMTCEHCSAAVRAAIAALEGVQHVTVDHATGKVEVSGDVERTEIERAVEDAGYELSSDSSFRNRAAPQPK